MMEYAFLYIFSGLFIVCGFFWYTLVGRGMYLISQTKKTFQMAESFEMFPEDYPVSNYMEQLSGTVVIKIVIDTRIILLQRRLLMESIKFNWHVVVISKTDLADAFYGGGFQAMEMNRAKRCPVMSKSAINKISPLFAKADFVDVKNGFAFCFKELGSIIGTSGLRVFENIISSEDQEVHAKAKDNAESN